MESPERDWSTAPLSELCRHIVTRYHSRVREDLPRIERLMLAARSESGQKETDLDTLLRGWRALAAELRAHLDKEESALFPMLIRLEQRDEGDLAVTDALLGGMGREHDDAALALLSLARVTRDSRPREVASSVLRELFDGLDRFGAEFREHVALENAVLLPRARRLARSMG